MVAGVGRFWVRFVSSHGWWRSLWVVAVVVGRGGRCGLWWSLWAMVVVVGHGGHCGLWWLLWAMAAIRFGVIVVVGRCRRLCSIGWFVDMGGGAVCLLVGAV